MLRALLPRACELTTLARVPWLALCAYLYAQQDGAPRGVGLDLRCQLFVEAHPTALVARTRLYAGQRPRFRRGPHVSS